MNPKSTLFALPEPWYTLVNVSLELPVGDDEGGDDEGGDDEGVDDEGGDDEGGDDEGGDDESEFLSRDSLGMVLLLSILL